MKNYLLTWYGITDLRAALGFEELGGPVLGALRTADFSDVIVLAYTDSEKTGEIMEAQQREMKMFMDRARSEQRALERQEESEIVDAFANTPAAHRLFKNWLRSEVEKLEVSVNIRLCIKELAALNDSKGIYDAVNQAMALVAQETGDKRLTFFLSPGTPVMAFTWAFVALTNPELDIQILSSSEPRKPPTVIALPYDLLAPSNRSLKQFTKGDVLEFDVVFHLFGEQRMPSLLGVTQFSSRRHIFVTSDLYSSESMKQFMPEGAWSELSVNPFDPMSTKVQILKEVASLSKETRVGFNLTGGTKLMFAGAIAACRKIGGVPFYFETREHSLVFLNDFRSMPIRGIDNLDLFFQANGFTTVNKGRWKDNPCRQQRIGLTRKLWKERSVIAKIYRQVAEYADDQDSLRPFRIVQNLSEQGRKVTLEISLDETGRAYFNLDGTEFCYKHSPDFAKYLSGAWLEEYAYLILEPLLQQSIIRDLRIGLDITWDGLSGKQDGPIQEFDVTLTDGKRLFIVECKAGSVSSDHVYKLQHCVRNYGGIDARGIMVCAFRPYHPITRKRLESANNLSALYGWDVTKQLAEVIAAAS